MQLQKIKKRKKEVEEEEKKLKITKQVICSRWYDANEGKMCKSENCLNKAWKRTVFQICKFADVLAAVSASIERFGKRTFLPKTISPKTASQKKQASHAILMHCFLVLYIQICNLTYILLTNSLYNGGLRNSDIIGSLRNDHWNGKDNATSQWFVW